MIAKLVVWFILCQVGLSQKKVGDTCVEEYTGSYGICVLSENCPSARTALEKNGVRPTFCLYTFDDSIVCCRHASDVDSYVPSAPSTSKTQPAPAPATPPVLVETSDGPPVWGTTSGGSQSHGKRVSEKKCVEYSSFNNPQKVFEVEPNELIVGGEPSELNEFPHMAAIGWLNFEDTYSFNCGGSLISSHWVLTAGHCTSDPTARMRAPSMVRLGDLNIDPGIEDGANPEEIPIKSIIRHPSYAPPLRYHDIALIMLVRPAAMSFAIHPACLWVRDQLMHSEAIAIGWGVSDVKTRRHSKILQKVALSLQESSYCDRLLYVNRNRNWSGLSPGQLCAGELRPGKDTCQGDSGAPLQVKVNNTYHIVGITSFGLNNCAESGRPAIYTRVSSYVAWIEEVVWPGE